MLDHILHFATGLLFGGGLELFGECVDGQLQLLFVSLQLRNDVLIELALDVLGVARDVRGHDVF